MREERKAEVIARPGLIVKVFEKAEQSITGDEIERH